VKKKLIVVSLIAALALPALAWASKRHFAGKILPHGHIAFVAKIDDSSHKVVKIKRGLTFDRVRIKCDSGRTKINGKFHTAIPVKHRQFTATGTYQGGGQVTIEGTFLDHARRAEGTIKVAGDFTLPDPDLTGCHGSHDWHATKRP
jgi:hypothetical protein